MAPPAENRQSGSAFQGGGHVLGQASGGVQADRSTNEVSDGQGAEQRSERAKQGNDESEVTAKH
ncbi:uncharacterized protein AB675_571 [Cyphellophora attinorum]|uniref:Uncharacterized protein n=1 Tax=Cyphellophora attinorum TaxID=1664694 RepID=A0A0N1HY71_9EURO|nr:uncharacterized protein AB675_571 [Phialophora attinorum]KPI45727.1 hypothetical protein AB675_571 [Phialophora attinorum]